MDLKLVFLLSCVVALATLSKVEAASRSSRQVEATEEAGTQVEKVQQQLMTAFDSLKKSMEELATKLNTEDIVQGVQNLTSKLENYVKQTADQFAASVSGTGTETKTETPVQPDQPASQ